MICLLQLQDRKPQGNIAVAFVVGFLNRLKFLKHTREWIMARTAPRLPALDKKQLIILC
jgi:hypothetical protein